MTWLKRYTYLLPVIFYIPTLTNFFSGDDWFHLRLSQIDSFQQYLNFFFFSQNAQSASFYRPLSTQFFFFVFQNLFGLSAWPYYLFGLLLFTYSIHLVFKFSNSRLAAFIYAISVTNFTRVYFLSAYQELFLVIFSLLTLTNFKSKPKLSLLFFVLALLSKETAIVLPLLVIVMNFEYIKKNFHNLRSTIYPTTILLGVYLYFRLLHFGLAVGDSYLWNFSPIKALNTLMWYTLWSLGSPELLVDYIGSGLKLIPRFYTDYQYWWTLIIFPLLIIIFTLFLFFLKNFKKLNSNLWMFVSFFVVSLLPVLFLPSHKFALELGLPLVGFAVSLSLLVKSSSKTLYFAFLGLYIFYNLSMNYLTYTRHYSVSRGDISRKVFDFVTQKYPKYSEDKSFLFINDTKDNGQIWGQSKQISQAVSGSEMFKVIYKNKDLKVYYEDLDKHYVQNQDTIEISTDLFLNP